MGTSYTCAPPRGAKWCTAAMALAFGLALYASPSRSMAAAPPTANNPAAPGLELQVQSSRLPEPTPVTSAASGSVGINANVSAAPSAWTPLGVQAELAQRVARRRDDNAVRRYLSWPTIVPPSPFERLMIRLRGGLVLYEGPDPRTGEPTAVRFYPSASLSFLRFEF